MSQIKKAEDLKTALKLLNKYAESHKLIEEENKSLKSEIKDLRSSLKINKEIIKGFAASNNSDKNELYIKLNDELKTLTLKNDKITKEKEELRSRLKYYEQVCGETKQNDKEELEKMKCKIFYFENMILKKDNMISMMKQKFDKLENSKIEKELYILEPANSVNILHDEVESYKQICEGLNEDIKDLVSKIEKYESIITKQHNEISKYRKDNKIESIFPVNYAEILNRDEEKMIIPSTSKRGKEDQMHSIRTCSDEGKNNLYSPAADNFPVRVTMNEVHKEYKEFLPAIDLTKINEKQTNKNNVKINKNINFLTDQISQNIYEDLMKSSKDWREIVSRLSLTKEEFNRIIYNRLAWKLVRAFEIIFKMISDKDAILNNSNAELKNLREANEELNREILRIKGHQIETKTSSNGASLNQKSLPRKQNIETPNKNFLTNNKDDDSLDNSMIVHNISIIQNESKVVNNFNEFNFNLKEENLLNDGEVEIKLNDEFNFDGKKKYSKNKTFDNLDHEEITKNVLTDNTEGRISNKKFHKFIENLNKGNLSQLINDKNKRTSLLLKK